MRRDIMFAMLAISVLWLSGCQRPEGIMGAVGVTMGDVEMSRKAARVVLVDEGAMVAIDRADGSQWLIEARYPDGTEIAIDFGRLSSSTTEVVVQVGHYGREKDSRRILEAIKQAVRAMKDIRIRQRAVGDSG